MEVGISSRTSQFGVVAFAHNTALFGRSRHHPAFPVRHDLLPPRSLCRVDVASVRTVALGGTAGSCPARLPPRASRPVPTDVTMRAILFLRQAPRQHRVRLIADRTHRINPAGGTATGAVYAHPIGAIVSGRCPRTVHSAITSSSCKSCGLGLPVRGSSGASKRVGKLIQCGLR
jgi:hypothetical protein